MVRQAETVLGLTIDFALAMPVLLIIGATFAVALIYALHSGSP